jgi:ferritin-like metal-binding protein YciE
LHRSLDTHAERPTYPSGEAAMSLRDVLVGELRDLYSAENQLVKALPKLVKAAEDQELSSSIQDHLEQTKGHVERLKEVFTQLETKPTGKQCKGMEGLIEEGKEAIEEDEEAPLGDILIIGAASRVEHYEIAGYTAVIQMAQALGEEEIAGLMNKTLQEEEAARDKLREKGQALIQSAAQEGDAAESEEEEGQAASGRKSPASVRISQRSSKKTANRSSRR